MGYVGCGVCDFCGRRTETFAGKLVLQAYRKKPGRNTGYDTYSPATARSWTLCKKCLSRIEGMETFGDRVQEEIEMQIDKARVEQFQPNLLIPNVPKVKITKK